MKNLFSKLVGVKGSNGSQGKAAQQVFCVCDNECGSLYTKYAVFPDGSTAEVGCCNLEC